MKRLTWFIPALLLFCVPANAQDTPAWEFAGGYSYLRANINGSSFHLNGGGGSITENLNSWFGGRFEFNAFQGNVSVPSATGTVVKSVSAQTFTYGPVFSYRKLDRVTPYGHVQFGAIHASQGYLGISASATKFAVAPGGGLDFKINQRAAVRIQADYVATYFLKARQDNVQFSAGIVIRIGSK